MRTDRDREWKYKGMVGQECGEQKGIESKVGEFRRERRTRPKASAGVRRARGWKDME